MKLLRPNRSKFISFLHLGLGCIGEFGSCETHNCCPGLSCVIPIMTDLVAWCRKIESEPIEGIETATIFINPMNQSA